MNLSKYKRIVFSLVASGPLLVALFLLLNGAPQIARADPGDLFVTIGGSGDCSQASPCDLQTALDTASDGDTIYIAEGIYTGSGGAVVTVTNSITLYGGWDGTTTTPPVRDPDAHPTTLDGEGARRVVYINGNISPTIDGFTITGGNANSETVGAGRGGGIYSEDASPTIQSNVIISNMASISPTTGSGGGIYLDGASASALISGNQVVSNTACVCWSSYGGGIYIGGSDATIQDNLILSNISGRDGGGAYVFGGSPRFLDNEVRTNVAGRNGGGMFLNRGFPLVQGNLIIGNLAGWDGSNWHGGGLMASYGGSPTITANRVFSNAAGTGAGVVVETDGFFTVTNNLIAHNSTCGIKVWDLTQYGLVAHNTVAFNTGSEGGIRLAEGYITPTVVNNIVVSNTYGIGAHTNSSGTLDYNDVWGNTTQDYDLPGALEPGPHDIQADPLLTNPAGDDFHLQASSPCIDAGTDAGMMSDIDGDPRPVGAGYDIGADEFRQRYIYLPLVEKNYP
jgi:hypothetical protein